MPRTLLVPLKELTLVLILLAGIPSLILCILGMREGLTVLIIYFQLVIIWIQTEISLRQVELFRSQATPIIVLNHSTVSTTHYDETVKTVSTVHFTVGNVSDNPAFNIMLSRILSENHTPIKPEVWSPLVHDNYIDVLAPGEVKELFSIELDKLKELIEKEKMKVLEVSYTDKYGEFHFSSFIISFKAGRLRVMSIVGEEPRARGILLSLLDKLSLYIAGYKAARRLEKLSKQQSPP